MMYYDILLSNKKLVPIICKDFYVKDLQYSMMVFLLERLAALID